MTAAMNNAETAPNGVMSNGAHVEHLLGLSRKTISQELHRPLPGRFYCSPEVYDLERRAIFSKRWFLVSHKARCKEVGDYVQYEMAGFNFVVLRNKEGRIAGFHNIGRSVLPGSA